MSNISSFLLSLHNIDCARQYKSKLSLHTLVLESLLAQGHLLRVVGFLVVEAPKLYINGACGGGIEDKPKEI